MGLRWSHFLLNLATALVVGWGGWVYLRAPDSESGPQPRASFALEARPSFREIENVCRLMEARPHWWRALLEAERRWQTPPHLTLAIVWRESSFVADARPLQERFYGFLPPKRLSSAYGYAQALDGTWDWYLRETSRKGARRESFADATDFIGWYLDRSRRQFGLAFDQAFDHYAAYHQGHSGYLRAEWRENPVVTIPARDVVRRSALYESQMAGCVRNFAARQAPAETPQPRPRPGRSAALQDL